MYKGMTSVSRRIGDDLAIDRDIKKFNWRDLSVRCKNEKRNV